MDDLVSVIIPVYNTSLYLRGCLDSVISQTYHNLEVILVDDGSSDGSGEICEEYKKDKRVTVFHQSNAGQAAARNHALQYANGMYIVYIDSDDYVSENHIADMVSAAKKYNSDLVQCSMKKYRGELYEQGSGGDTCGERISVYTAAEALKEFCYQRKFSPSPCAKLMKKDLMCGLDFPINMGYEDFAVMYKVFGRAKRITFLPQVSYYYRQHTASTMHTGFSDKKADRIKIAGQLLEYVEKKFPENKKAVKTRYLLANLQLLMDLPFDAENAYLRNEVKSNIKRVRREVICDGKSRNSIRIMACASYLGMPALMCLGRIYKKINEVLYRC